jgi:hypothetical protein
MLVKTQDPIAIVDANMPSPISGSTGGEFEQHALPPHEGKAAPITPPGEGRQLSQHAQPALGGLTSRSSGGSARTNEPANDNSGAPEEGLRYHVAAPIVSFLAGQNVTQPARVVAPEGFAAIVGEGLPDGTMLTGGLERLTVQEVVTHAIANASVELERPSELAQPFYLAIQGGQRSVGQRWADVTRQDVAVQLPLVSRYGHGNRPIVKADAANSGLQWFEPGSTETANVVFEDGRLLLTGVDGTTRVVSPRRHLGELLFWRTEGAFFRLGDKWAAKMFFPDLDAFASLKQGKKTLEPLASRGLPVQAALAEPERLPSGLIVQYFELPAATDLDILPMAEGSENDGQLILRGAHRIDYSRALMLNEQTITELDTMARIIRSDSPFADKNGYAAPITIGFDDTGLPYFCDPMLMPDAGYRKLNADITKEGTLQLIGQLRAVATQNIARRRALEERGD